MPKVARITPVVCSLVFVLTGCSHQKSSPTAPEGHLTQSSAPGSPPEGDERSSSRAEDPPDGARLPLPDMSLVIQQVAAEHPGALRASCQDHGGSWEFMDRVVDELRTHDTRWGYNGKRGNADDPSKDVVDYHWGGGDDEHSIDVYIIDVIVGHCGDNPSPGWGDVTDATREGGSIGRWTARGRF